MIRTFAFVFAVLSSTWVVALPARACSCMTTSLDDAVASSTAIFEGRVERLTTDGDRVVVGMAVTQAWAGVEREHVEVRTRADSASCGYPFEEGARYLVFATGEPGRLEVSLCSHTARIEDAGTDRAALGAGVIPVDVADEAVEPVRPQRTEPPARGGCASCTVGRASPPGWLLGLSALALFGLRRKDRA